MTPERRKHLGILVKKVKVGTWYPRTFYDVTVQGYYVGRYETIRDADRAGETHLQQIDEFWEWLAATHA